MCSSTIELQLQPEVVVYFSQVLSDSDVAVGHILQQGEALGLVFYTL